PRVDQQLALAQDGLEVRQVLGLVAERHAEDDHVRGTRRVRVLEPLEAASGDRRLRARRGVRGAAGATGADHDRDAGAADPDGEAAAKGAGGAEDGHAVCHVAAQSMVSGVERTDEFVVEDRLPDGVRIREVGPRDGFQNEPEVIPAEDKVRLIELLGATGLRRIEVTSFVRPDVIPQLADAEEVLDAVRLPEEVAVSVLIPNERGLERALSYRERFQEINGFLSSSETHNQKNVGRSIEESLAGLERTFARASDEGLRCEGVISTSFGCPYE